MPACSFSPTSNGCQQKQGRGASQCFPRGGAKWRVGLVVTHQVDLDGPQVLVAMYPVHRVRAVKAPSAVVIALENELVVLLERAVVDQDVEGAKLAAQLVLRAFASATNFQDAMPCHSPWAGSPPCRARPAGAGAGGRPCSGSVRGASGGSLLGLGAGLARRGQHFSGVVAFV